MPKSAASRQPSRRTLPRRKRLADGRRTALEQLTDDIAWTDSINWHFVLLSAVRARGLRVCAGGGVVQQHRADGVLSGAVAGRDGRAVLSGRRRFRRRDAILIYVGGTLVLLVFGVMLTAKSPFISMKTAAGELDSGGDRGRLAVGRADSGRHSACQTGKPGRRSRASRRATADDRHAVRHGAARRARRRLIETDASGNTRHVGLLAAVRNRLGALAGRADRRGVPGPRKATKAH